MNENQTVEDLQKELEIAKLEAKLRNARNKDQNQTIVGDVIDDVGDKVGAVNVVTWGIIPGIIVFIIMFIVITYMTYDSSDQTFETCTTSRTGVVNCEQEKMSGFVKLFFLILPFSAMLGFLAFKSGVAMGTMIANPKASAGIGMARMGRWAITGSNDKMN
jgi:tetrahydromethanopterin S-methyltransferase subunit G